MPEKGKVKWFSNVKGFGFIEKEGGGQDIFVHYASIQSEGYKTLEGGEEVTFDVTQGEKGPQAANVVRTKKKEEKKEAVPAAAAPAEKKPEKKQEAPAKKEEKAEKKEEKKE